MFVNQRGSILLDTVLFLALLSVFSMALLGQLIFMTKVSAQEDARVQGLMAARVQMENMRTRWQDDWLAPSPTPAGWSHEETFVPSDFEVGIGADRHSITMLDHGVFKISRVEKGGTPPSYEPNLYQVAIELFDRVGRSVCKTVSRVWVKP